MSQLHPARPAGERPGGPVDGAAIAGAIACAVAAVGSMMSWVTVQTIFGSVSASGFDAGDGKITVVAAITSGIIIYTARRDRAHRRTLAVLAALSALIVGAVGIYDTVNVSVKAQDVSSSGFASAHVGAGLWLVDLAAVAMIISLVKLAKRRAPTPPVATYPASASATAQAGPLGSPSQVARKSVPVSPVPAQRIREWAIAEGLSIKAQGPIPQYIRDQYLANAEA